MTEFFGKRAIFLRIIEQWFGNMDAYLCNRTSVWLKYKKGEGFFVFIVCVWGGGGGGWGLGKEKVVRC